jgi:hypothetical protein
LIILDSRSYKSTITFWLIKSFKFFPFIFLSTQAGEVMYQFVMSIPSFISTSKIRRLSGVFFMMLFKFSVIKNRNKYVVIGWQQLSINRFDCSLDGRWLLWECCFVACPRQWLQTLLLKTRVYLQSFISLISI